MQETYSTVINNELQKEQFSKVKENSSTGYRLSINKKQFENVIIQILETLKNDQNTLDKLNQYAKKQQNSAKITASTIDNYIKSIEEDTEESDVTWEITVWVQKGKTIKMSITNPKNGLEITFEKKKEEDNLQYNASLTVNDENLGDVGIYVSANYRGLKEMQTVKEEYSVELQMQESETTTVKYQFENQIDFTDAVEIEEFSNKNAMLLNNYEEEKVSNFLQQVGNRISQVNKSQMEELGLQENENPLIQMFSPIFGAAVYSQAANTIGSNNLTEMEVTAFNQTFENYVGTNIQGTTVKGLITTVQLNMEEQEEEKIKEIHFDGEEYEVTEQNIAFIKDGIERETAYRVEVEKDENTGLIYRIVINKK